MSDKDEGKKAGEEAPKKEVSSQDLQRVYKGKLAQGILEGKTGLASELIELEKAEKARNRPRATPLEKLKPKRPYHMSPEAIQARKDNAKKSTGPRTPEGKARSSRNARGFGHAATKVINRIIKPCFSTCEHFNECEFVLESQTEPGGDCLDRGHFLDALSAITKALDGSDKKGFDELMSVELSAALDVIQQCREAVSEFGVIVKSYKTDSDGGVIAEEWKLNPALLALPKLLKDFGISLSDFNLTPAAAAKVKQGDDLMKSAADIMSALAGRGKGEDD